MSKVRQLGLCLGAAFAIAAVMATSASAVVPEFGQCVPVAHGNYADAGCTKGKPLGKGTFEWRRVSEITGDKSFRENESVAHPAALIAKFNACNPGRTRQSGSCASRGEEEEKGGPLGIECTNEFHRGEVSGSKEVAHVGISFEHCAVFGTAPCANTPTEEIQVNPLRGSLGYIKHHPKQVGILLTPEKAPEPFAQFSCLGVITTVVGQGNAIEGTAYKEANGEENKGGNDGIIAPITPINEMTKFLVQTYTFNSKLENIPSRFLEGQRESLETYEYSPFESAFGSRWSPAGQQVTAESAQENGEEIEIKA
jgi:hypothetical protein